MGNASQRCSRHACVCGGAAITFLPKIWASRAPNPGRLDQYDRNRRALGTGATPTQWVSLDTTRGRTENPRSTSRSRRRVHVVRHGITNPYNITTQVHCIRWVVVTVTLGDNRSVCYCVADYLIGLRCVFCAWLIYFCILFEQSHCITCLNGGWCVYWIDFRDMNYSDRWND